jgi:hypothetical protein
MQKLNPGVAVIWIRHSHPRPSASPGDAVLDMLVFGIHISIDPAQYEPALRREIEQFLRRASAYNSARPAPSALDVRMVHAAQVSYETRLAAVSEDSRAPALAASYVTRLRPCYEWEGLSGCPEREAQFADQYQAANPNSPFRDYLSLLAAHRRLCAAEGFDEERKPVDADHSRRLYQERLAVARRSSVFLIRTAADRLAARGRCFPPN